jgi:hypothetical protein
MSPVDEVPADGMTPAHMSPYIPKWIVLVKQVILAVEEHQSVRIVHEIQRWGEVIAGAISHVLFYS